MLSGNFFLESLLFQGEGRVKNTHTHKRKTLLFFFFLACSMCLKLRLKQPFVGCKLGNESSCNAQNDLKSSAKGSEVRDGIDECKWYDTTSPSSNKPRERLIFEISLGRSRSKVGHFQR